MHLTCCPAFTCYTQNADDSKPKKRGVARVSSFSVFIEQQLGRHMPKYVEEQVKLQKAHKQVEALEGELEQLRAALRPAPPSEDESDPSTPPATSQSGADLARRRSLLLQAPLLHGSAPLAPSLARGPVVGLAAANRRVVSAGMSPHRQGPGVGPGLGQEGGMPRLGRVPTANRRSSWVTAEGEANGAGPPVDRAKSEVVTGGLGLPARAPCPGTGAGVHANEQRDQLYETGHAYSRVASLSLCASAKPTSIIPSAFPWLPLPRSHQLRAPAGLPQPHQPATLPQPPAYLLRPHLVGGDGKRAGRRSGVGQPQQQPSSGRGAVAGARATDAGVLGGRVAAGAGRWAAVDSREPWSRGSSCTTVHRQPRALFHGAGAVACGAGAGGVAGRGVPAGLAAGGSERQRSKVGDRVFRGIGGEF